MPGIGHLHGKNPSLTQAIRTKPMADRPYNLLFLCTGNSAVEGSEPQKWVAFRAAFNVLGNRIKSFTSLPLASIDRMKPQERLDAIARRFCPRSRREPATAARVRSAGMRTVSGDSHRVRGYGGATGCRQRCIPHLENRLDGLPLLTFLSKQFE